MAQYEKHQAPLPLGYGYMPVEEISTKDILEVRGERYEPDFSDSFITWMSCLQNSLAVVGVAGCSRLIGIGFLAGNRRHGVLCDLAVHPDHRSQGIGAAIVLERMRIAGELQIPYLYTALSDENPLRHMYERLGFEPHGNNLFRRMD